MAIKTTNDEGYEVHHVDTAPIPEYFEKCDFPYTWSKSEVPHPDGKHVYIGIDGGIQTWWVDGKLSREDGPALFSIDMDEDSELEGVIVYEYWYYDGLRHRGTYADDGSWVDSGPAATHPDGKKEWYQNDELHRLDGPAVIYSNGSEEWYQNGKHHRVDGPAIIEPFPEAQSGGVFAMIWYIDGKLHREDGPAIIYPEDATVQDVVYVEVWYRDGKELNSGEIEEIKNNNC